MLINPFCTPVHLKLRVSFCEDTFMNNCQITRKATIQVCNMVK